MQISDVSVPEIYRTSADFRFFLKWFETALTKVHYDTEHADDLYDPLKCPAWLLWMLADTMGYKYDTRLPVAFNRAVLVYFMSMIRNRGSKDGVTLAAEVNLKQFDINTVAGIGYENSEGEYVEPKDILYNRLEDTSIPVNSAVVTPHTPEGYIDVTYFSDELPIDACIEYVRPVGMYIFQHAGVRMDGRTKITISAELADMNNVGMSIGPTHVGHYSRDDYARLQRINTDPDDTNVDIKLPKDSYEYKLGHIKDNTFGIRRSRGTGVWGSVEQHLSDQRRNVWYRNSEAEGSIEPIQGPSKDINPGYRALYSLQLCNNEHIVKSLIPTKPGEPVEDKNLRRPNFLFGLGWEPQDVSIEFPDTYHLQMDDSDFEPGKGVDYSIDVNGRIRPWNLRYDKSQDDAYFDRKESDESSVLVKDITTIDGGGILNPKPMVNPVMHVLGDAMSLPNESGDIDNKEYIIAVNNDAEYPEQFERQTPDTSDLQDGKYVYGDADDGKITPKSE